MPQLSLFILSSPPAAFAAHFTRKGTLLERTPCGKVTLTFPVVAPRGTVVVIKDLETTVNVVFKMQE